MKALVSALLGFLLVFGIVGCLSVSHFIPGGPQQALASVTMVIISLIAGSLLARREPIKSFLARKSVLWFLFLFNCTAGVLIYLFVDGMQGLLTAIGLCVVGLGSGSGLVFGRRPRSAGSSTEPDAITEN